MLLRSLKSPVLKNQGSDEGALRIPDVRSPARTFKKRFPHRFLPSGGATVIEHSACQTFSDFHVLYNSV
jgi:hypothetical protein